MGRERGLQQCSQLLHTILTLEQLGSSVRRTAAERVQLSSRLELVAKTKVGNFDVEVTVKQEILRLSPTNNRNYPPS